MSSKSRYDYMKQGNVADEITHSYYPDPLSLNYGNFELHSLPKSKYLSESEVQNFLTTVRSVYNSDELDDVLLSLNGCPHINFLKTGDRLLFPDKKDIQDSFSKQR